MSIGDEGIVIKHKNFSSIQEYWQFTYMEIAFISSKEEFGSNLRRSEKDQPIDNSI
ncbi:MAG: hypothetical protein ABR555_02765 [Pyrinomonadaceae bacterium]